MLCLTSIEKPKKEFHICILHVDVLQKYKNNNFKEEAKKL